MLETLNLRLSPVELLDNSEAASGLPVPGIDSESSSGFARLLSMRVDGRLEVGYGDAGMSLPTGELLPSGGRSLPRADHLLPQGAQQLPIADNMPGSSDGLAIPVQQLAPPVSKDTLASPDLSNTQSVQIDSPRDPETSDISLESEVVYPPISETLSEASLFVANPLVPEITAPVRLDSATKGIDNPVTDVADSLKLKPWQVPLTPVTRPELAARTQDGLAPTGLRIDGPTVNAGLVERRQNVTLTAGTPRTNPIAKTVDSQTQLPLAQLPLANLLARPEISPLQQPERIAELLPEGTAPRAVPQAAHSAHAQLNTTLPLATLVTASNLAPGNEVTYTAVAQQATDLIGTPVRNSAWGELVGERVVMMIGSQLKTAEIRLTPAELGPLQVRVAMEDGAANVTFHAQHAVTREAIEQAMPRLREMLAENGLSLGQTEVGEQGVNRGDKDGKEGAAASNQPVDEPHGNAAEADNEMTHSSGTPNGLVDTFA